MLSIYLPIESVGVFFYSVSVVFLGSIIGRFGLDVIITRVVGSNSVVERSLESIYASVFTFSILVSFFFGLMHFFFICFGFLDNSYYIVYYVLPAIPLSSIMYLYSGYNRGVKKSIISSILEVGIVPSVLVISVFFINLFIGLDVKKVAFLYLSSFIVCFIIGWLLSDRPNPKIKDINYQNFLLGKNVAQSALSDYIVNWFPIFVIGMMSSSTEVAQYNYAVRLAMIISFILVVFNSINSSEIAMKSKKMMYSEVQYLYLSNRALMGLYSFILFLIICISSKEILSFFGDDYSSGWLILIFSATAQFVNVIFGANGVLLNMSGKDKDFRNIVIYSSIITVVFSIPATYFFGGVGAMISTLLGVTIKNIFSTFLCYKYFRINTTVFGRWF